MMLLNRGVKSLMTMVRQFSTSMRFLSDCGGKIIFEVRNLFAQWWRLNEKVRFFYVCH